MEAADVLPTQVSFAPTLLNDLDEAISLMPGQEWELVLEPFDVDDDLATIDVEFSGESALWIEFDQATNTILTANDLGG